MIDPYSESDPDREKSLPPLRGVDQVDLISLQDNMVELLCTVDRPEVEPVTQWVPQAEGDKMPLTVAEHGFAMLIRTRVGRSAHWVLFDAGLTESGTLKNARIMKLDLTRIEAVVLSHSHHDHCGGLVSLLKQLNKDEIPLVLHRDMFTTRGIEADGNIRRLEPFPSKEKLTSLGAKVITTKHPCLLAGDTVLVMGEVPRVTEFEKGFAPGRVLREGEWQPDPWMRDDRGIVIRVKGKGLVVISGCAHSGIVNNLRHAQALTDGRYPITAVLGGFHLAGKAFESIIEPTVAAVKQMNPAMVVPSHCTGWKGLHAFAREMPSAFVHPSTGNRYRFEGTSCESPTPGLDSLQQRST